MRRFGSGEHGAALVSAIFLLVVLAALGAYMITVSGVQQTTTSRAVISARAYFAARAGLEWGIHRTVSPAFVSGAPCPATATFTPAGFGFDDVVVTVECSLTQYSPGTPTNIYVLTSTARHGSAGTQEYVERRLEAAVCRADENNPQPTTRCGRGSI